MLFVKNIDVLAISESWLTPDIPDHCIHLDQFNFARNDRGLRPKTNSSKNKTSSNRKPRRFIQGGGVLLYIKTGISFKVLAESRVKSIDDTEYLILELIADNAQKFLVAVVYRRPKGHVLNTFFNQLRQFAHLYMNIVLLGDFNSDILCPANSPYYYYTSSLVSLINEHGFFNVPYGATHHATIAGTWLDLIIVDSSDKVLSFDKSEVPFICNHDYLILDYKLESTNATAITVRSRDFRNFNLAQFTSKLNNTIDTSPFDTYINTDPNQLVIAFQNASLSTLDEMAPFVVRMIRKNPAPWFTPQLRDKCKQRDRTYNKAKKLKCPALLSKYRAMRKEIKKDIKVTREKYFSHKLNSTLNYSKKWCLLNKLGVVGTRENSPLTKFSAHELNTFYASIATAHPPCSLNELANILAIPLNRNAPIFDVKSFTNVQVTQACLAALPKARGRSVDDLPLTYFRDCMCTAAKYMTDIFNTSLNTGIYPEIWKRALVIPLNKIAKPATPSDTRPISNLAHFAKVFDKLVTEQLLDYLETNNLLSPLQSGFRKHFSTQSALIKITDDIRRGIDKEMVTILILFDFKKAFDSVKHSTLLRAMRNLNCSDNFIRWFLSYLSGRSQAIVDLRGFISDFINLTSGIPQGSNPGPVAFLILIDSIVKCLIHCSENCMLFADDFQIYIQCKRNEIPDCIRKLNEDAQRVFEWASTFDLTLNSSKIVAIIFGSDQNLKLIDPTILPHISINGHTIEIVKSIKNLGVVLRENLNWNTHVARIASRVHGVLKRLRFRANFLSLNIKKQLVTALIFPHFDYCSLVYCDITDYLNTKLQRLQNHLVRFIFRLRRDAPLKPYYQRLNWLQIKDRRKYFMAVTTYKILTTGKPGYLVPCFPKVNDDIRRSARSLTVAASSSFALPQINTTTYENSFSYMAMKLWDTLPCPVRLKPSIAVFKEALFKYLLSKMNDISDD